MDLLPKRFFSGSEMSFGLAAGYKRVKWLIDVSTGEDEALYAFKLYGYGVGGGPGYIKTQLTGVTYYRTSAMLGARLMWLDQSGASRRVRWELWGTLAAHRWRRHDGPSKIDLRGSWEVSATETIAYSLDQNSQTATSAFIAPGLMIKGFNRKGHSIVNLHVQYAWGLSREQPFAGRFSFTHQPSGDQAYAGFSSRGDGLYVAVSKDFYLNNVLRIFKRKPASEAVE
ncbi:MAG TPA: hypothetical protein PKY96_12370 [Flavobacteriales bacterium]|nr:hypothetical protein [Flavobacteriales bacterium]